LRNYFISHFERKTHIVKPFFTYNCSAEMAIFKKKIDKILPVSPKSALKIKVYSLSNLFLIKTRSEMIDFTKRYCIGAGVGALAFFPCEKLSQFLNRHNPKKPLDFSLVDRDVKIHCFCIGVLTAPLCEEVVYRGVIQGVVLQKLSGKVFRPIFAKYARILAVSLLFAYPHHNKEYAFFLGLELGMLKESRLKLAGCIGAHMANNCLSLKPLFIKEA